MQKIFSIILIVFSLMIIDSCKKNSTGPDEPSVITFADANFEALIREALNKPTGDIAPDELEAITSLTGNVGHPKLKEHLSGVMALMRTSANWRSFKDTLARAYPKLNEQIPLALDIEEE